MAHLPPKPSFLRASATDAGNMSMRRAGRTRWNADDWNLMVETLDRLVTAIFGPGIEGRFAFQMAERTERA